MPGHHRHTRADRPRTRPTDRINQGDRTLMYREPTLPLCVACHRPIDGPIEAIPGLIVRYRHKGGC